MDEIEIVLETLTSVLSNNENYRLLIQGNQFDREIYQKYEVLVNELFNKFKPERIKRESICADDGLVAASVILLKKLKKPVGIVSGDSGVTRRIRILNAFILTSKEDDYFYREMRYLLRSVGISVYSNLNSEEVYNLSGRTNNYNLLCSLDKDDKSTYFFRSIIDEIISLEQKYDQLLLKNAV